jgi:hypothetical protein
MGHTSLLRRHFRLAYVEVGWCGYLVTGVLDHGPARSFNKPVMVGYGHEVIPRGAPWDDHLRFIQK